MKAQGIHGFGIAEAMIAAAIVTIIMAAMTQMLKQTSKAVQKTESAIDRAGLVRMVRESTNCEVSFPPPSPLPAPPAAVPPPCTNGSFIPLLNRDGSELVAAAGSLFGDTANPNAVVWGLKARCGTAGIEVRAVRLSSIGRPLLAGMNFGTVTPAEAFQLDESGSTAPGTAALLRQDWAHPQAILMPNLCARAFQNPRNESQCNSPDVAHGVDAGGNLDCAPPLPASTLCPLGQKVIQVFATGQFSCGPSVVGRACPAGSKINVLNPDGSATCETNVPATNNSCPANQKVVGVNRDGSRVCADVIDRRENGLGQFNCGPGRKATGFDSDGTLFCELSIEVTNNVCPAGQRASGLNSRGQVQCAPVVPGQTCPNGQRIVGLDSLGNPICQTAVQLASCPPGQRTVGLNSDGTQICRTTVPGSTCPGGERASGITSNGTLVCQVAVTGGVCPAGQRVSQLNGNGAPRCEPNVRPGSCPAGQKVNGIASDGSVRCAPNVAAASCGGGQFANGLNSNGSVSCQTILEGSTCPTGQDVVGINIDGTAICGLAPVRAFACSSSQVVLGINSDGSLRCHTIGTGSPIETTVGASGTGNCSNPLICPAGFYMWGYEALQTNRTGQTFGSGCRVSCRRFYQ